MQNRDFKKWFRRGRIARLTVSSKRWSIRVEFNNIPLEVNYLTNPIMPSLSLRFWVTIRTHLAKRDQDLGIKINFCIINKTLQTLLIWAIWMLTIASYGLGHRMVLPKKHHIGQITIEQLRVIKYLRILTKWNILKRTQLCKAKGGI